jgi:predicted GNAT family acetyltransferase
MEQYEVIHNEANKQFEVHVGSEVAALEYRHYKHNDIALMHTFVPETLRGKGIAGILAKYAMDYIKDQHKLAMVYCPYVASWLKRHPEYDYLVDKSYRG